MELQVWIISLVSCLLHLQIEGTPAQLEIPNNERDIRNLLAANSGHEGLTLALRSIQNNRSPKDAYIIVLGISGAGKSSTIKRLVQGQLPTTGSADSIQEYILPVPLPALGISNARLHIIDTPGFGESDGIEADARLLATLRKLRRGHAELNTKLPTSILILSRFDDNRASGESSKFVKMLKGFNSTLKDGFLPTQSGESNVIFLFTRFMSETKAVTKRPQDRIKFFENIIRDFTQFPAPITVKVGENYGEEKDLKFVNGSYDLPNKERYPENVIKSMIESANRNGDPMGARILEYLLGDNGGAAKFEFARVKPVNHLLSQASTEDVQFFMNILGGQIISTESNEVNNALATAYENLAANLKQSSQNALQLVQTACQHSNIKKFEDVPKTTKEIAKFLQTIDLNPTAIEILDKGLGLKIPYLYTTKFIVGYGYDVLQDQDISTSPFNLDNLEKEAQPSPLGYKIPAMLSCELTDWTSDTFDFPNSYHNYVQLRKLELQMNDCFNDTLFQGQTREGHNLNDEAGLTSFTAVRDVWKFKLELKETTSSFSSEFIEGVNSLTPIDTGNQESVKEWKNFLNKYGTHIVTSAFGGGSMISTVSAEKFKSLITTQSGINELKSYLLDFQPVRGIDEVSQQYRYLGGEPEQTMSEINQISGPERTRLIDDWKSSILTNPFVLQTKLSLKPISVYVRKVRSNIADEVDRAIQLLFKGELEYRRVKQSSRPVVVRPAVAVTVRPTSPPAVENSRGRNEQDDTPYRPPCPSCPICPARQPESCSRAPPVTPQPCSNVAPALPTKQGDGRKKPKPLDVTLNIVGQSYDLLRDTVMEASPYSYTPQLILKWKENYNMDPEVKVDILTNPDCPVTFHQFSTRKDYIKHRLYYLDSTTAGETLSPTSEIYRLHGSKIKPGYNVIHTSHPLADITRLEEIKIAKIYLYHPYGSTPKFNPAFRRAVEDLPDITARSVDREQCNVKKAWVTFFETYGTHVVTSAFVGQSVTTTVTGKYLTLNSTFPLNPTIDCKAPPKRDGDFVPAWLQTDMTVTRISQVIRQINSSLTLAADDAIFGWFDGRLAPC